MSSIPRRQMMLIPRLLASSGFLANRPSPGFARSPTRSTLGGPAVRLSLTRRRLTLLAVIVLFAPVLVSMLLVTSARGQGGDVVISQVYAGGQSGAAPIRSDYIELFNPGTDAVRIDGWSIQYAAATGTTWRGTTLTGTIPLGGFFLVPAA
jgi:hypothetical protein